MDALRYPGGSSSDVYHWQSNTTVSGQSYANPANGFDDFMGVASRVGAAPIITVNYGSGTAAEAASWVKYANVTKGYGVKYWELGNEVYGDGTYGASWEYNTKSKGATAYADNIASYITQIKAADSSIKVGAVLTTYGNWPDGKVASNYGDSASWNQTVLQKDGAHIDFVILHYYPTSTTESGMLAQYQNIAAIVKQTRAEINEHAGSNAANIKIMITETDADGTTDYGDEGLLSNASCGGGTCEPAADTVFPTYYGLKAVGDFAPSGATMVATTSSNSTVTAYAVRQSSGAVNVMLVNHSASASEPVTLAYAGIAPSSVTSAEQFTAGTKKLSSLSGVSDSALTLPAYSITVLTVGAKSSTGCAVTATKTSDSGGAFSEQLVIKNVGSSAVSGWKLGFVFSGNQKITGGSGATYHQVGVAVLAHPVSGDADIAAGASVTIGYSASYTGTNTAPGRYALDGVRCAL